MRTISINTSALAALLLSALLLGCNLGGGSSAGAAGPDLGNVHIQVFRTHKSADSAAMHTDSTNPTGTGAVPQATVTATGDAIGTLSGWLKFTGAGYEPSSESEATFVQVHTSAHSILATFEIDNGKMQPIYPLYYVSNDCSGTPYVSPPGPAAIQQGIVFRDLPNGAGNVWWLQAGADSVTLDVGSQRVGADGHCQPGTITGIGVWPLVANDVASSGIPDAALGNLVVN